MRDPVASGGNLLVDLLNGGKVIEMDYQAGRKSDGYLHEKDGKSVKFREKEVNHSGIMHRISMPVTNDLLQLHQVCLATARHYGMDVNNAGHHVKGGILDGVLKEGETMGTKFDCVPISPTEDSLIATGLAEAPSHQCDGDHCFGREDIFLNGAWMVQGVAHRENIIRGYERGRAGEWLFPLLVGKYDGGVKLPTNHAVRQLLL